MKKETLGIVVAYNIDINVLKQNINSYIEYVDKVLVIDNSDNDKLKKIENEDIIYKYLDGNKGIGKALNIGAKFAIKNDYKYVLTMDQDSLFDNNLLEIYKKHLAKNIIIYSPNYIIERKKERKYNDDTKELYWTMTSGNLLNLEMYAKNGEFREDFFIDAVDYEYCLKARKNGYKILQCNDAKLRHNPGITKNKKMLFLNYKYGYMSPTRLYYQVRNLSYLAKEYKCFRAKIIILVKLIKIVFLFEEKKKFFSYFKKAKYDFKHKITGKILE